MAKFYGPIGFSVTQETVPGVWQPTIKEENYYGDVLQRTFRWQSSNKVNDDVEVTNNISILGDRFAYENFSAIKYIVYLNQKWKVTSVEVQYPRLILSIGGVYNGE